MKHIRRITTIKTPRTADDMALTILTLIGTTILSIAATILGIGGGIALGNKVKTDTEA